MRPWIRLPLLLVAAGALTGCATFTDNDVAARVDDDTLTTDELTSIAREQLGDDAGRADMGTVVTILNNWVLDRVLRADLAAGGNPIDEVPGELTNDTLTSSVNQSFQAWQQADTVTIDDEAAGALYARGPVASNLICTAHVLVDDEAIAVEVLARLDDGDDFADLAAEYSIDGSAQSGGNLPCGTTADFSAQYIPEFVDAALAADIGVPVGPVESQFGYHVIVVRTYDDAADELAAVLATPQVRFTFASEAVDVYVDPRYGTFEAANGVVPLG